MLIKGLILLSAAGVKIRERNHGRLRLMPDGLRLCFIG
jgi:hypothetical protein